MVRVHAALFWAVALTSAASARLAPRIPAIKELSSASTGGDTTFVHTVTLSSSSTTPTTGWSNTTAISTSSPIENQTSTVLSSSLSAVLSLSPSSSSSSCVPSPSTGPITVYETVPNTTTITLPYGYNATSTPEFTPTPYCSSRTPFAIGTSTRLTTTVIITSKNPVTVFTTSTPPNYPTTSDVSKTSVNPNVGVVKPSKNPSSSTTATHVTQTTTPGKAITGGQSPGGVSATKTSSGRLESATTATSAYLIIGGDVISAIGSSVAVIGGQTYTYGSGIPQTTDVFNGATITMGPNGIELVGTTLGGSTNPSATQIGIVGGLSVTEIGSTIAVIDGTTFKIGPGATATTAVIMGETIIADSTAIDIGTITTLAYPLNPTTLEVTAGGITISEIGSTKVVIGQSTFQVGSGAKTTTEVYEGQTISIGPNGVGLETTTIVPPTATSTTDKSGASALKPGWKVRVFGLCIATGVGIIAF